MTKRGNAKNTSTMMEMKRRKTREENEITKRKRRRKNSHLRSAPLYGRQCFKIIKLNENSEDFE